MNCYELPDSVWLNIFCYLHHQDLISIIEIGKTSNWLPGRVAQDRTLWKSVLWKVNKPIKNNKKYDIKKIIPYLKKYTTAIHIEGCQQVSISPTFYEQLLYAFSLCLYFFHERKLAQFMAKCFWEPFYT